MTSSIVLARERAQVLSTVAGSKASEQARALARKRRTANTQRAYAGAWGRFEAWAKEEGRAPLPAGPELVAEYVGHLDLEQLSPATVDVALAAIAMRHREAGHPSPSESPEVRAVRAGFRRERGTAPKGQKAPLGVAELRAMVANLDPDEPLDARDGAMILLAFVTALRRSELVALDLGDVQEVEEGLEVHRRRSKTDQEGEGAVLPAHWADEAALCPVRAVVRWLEHRGRDAGPLFMSARGDRLGAPEVNRRIKLHAARAGLDPARFGGHSPRAGFVTTALEQGASGLDIAKITGHASLDVVARYDRRRAFRVRPVRI